MWNIYILYSILPIIISLFSNANADKFWRCISYRDLIPLFWISPVLRQILDHWLLVWTSPYTSLHHNFFIKHIRRMSYFVIKCNVCAIARSQYIVYLHRDQSLKMIFIIIITVRPLLKWGGGMTAIFPLKYEKHCVFSI